MSRNLKKRVTVCKELIGLCDILSIDISQRNNSLTKLLGDGRFQSLDFLNSEMLKQRMKINSPLSAEDNELVSDFIYSLGKSDSNSQLKLIETFRKSIEQSKRKYEVDYSENSRLYLAFGLFGGVVFSLIII